MTVIRILDPDRNPAYPQNKIDWSLAKDTPLMEVWLYVKVLCLDRNHDQVSF